MQQVFGGYMGILGSFYFLNIQIMICIRDLNKRFVKWNNSYLSKQDSDILESLFSHSVYEISYFISGIFS